MEPIAHIEWPSGPAPAYSELLVSLAREAGLPITTLEGTAMITCDCSDEYGPCEHHGETLVMRDGAAARTADELALLLVEDLVSVGAELSATGRLDFKRLTDALERDRNPQTGVAWFSDPDDADAAQDLAFQVEQYVGDLCVMHDDGYRIVRPSKDCPLYS